VTASPPTAESVQTLFNRIAPVYDRLNHQLSFGLHHVWKKMTVKWSQAQPGNICLDLCCGSGDLTLLLARQAGPTGFTYGVDFSAALLAVAQQRAEKLGLEAQVQWTEADVLQLPFPDQTFDAITMGYGLRNVTDISGCLREMRRVLKPKAKAAILDFHQPVHPVSRLLQQWYLDQIVVPTAAQLDLAAEYAYLGPSVARFPQGPEQVELSYEAGFRQAVHYPILGGMMGVLVVTNDAATQT
jgi:demethylphylloquinol methyltransferase